MTVYNEINEIYVNTSYKDGTLVSELMGYFENSNGINSNFKKLSYRVEQFKNDENEVTSMASLFDEYAEEHMAEQAKAVAIKLLKKGLPLEVIAEAIPSFSIEDIKQLQQNELVNA